MKTAGIPGFILLALLLAASRPVFAYETIGWQGLVPPLDESLDPYTRLSEDQQNSLYDLWMVRELRVAGSPDKDFDDLELEAVANLAAGGFDADTVLKELDVFVATVEANNSRLVEDLDGKDVRIPGYVLPTEFSGSKVVEFLLVPYVGACVHSPPPPVNQMVHVRVDEGFVSEGLFAPVWVTGKISTAMTTQSISLVDGQRDVEAGYRIRASGVIPYE